MDYYITAAGDTLAALSTALRLSAVKIAEFNALSPGAPLGAGTKLRLIPADVPIDGAEGASTVDAAGVPLTYTAAPEDGTDGISYRFGLTVEQLDEANMVPAERHTQLRPYPQAGRTIQLQKHPVNPRSGTGNILYNMVGNPDYYWTVAGDSLDGIGYRVRRTRGRLLALNPGLAADAPIPPGTRLRLAPLDQAAVGAQGTFTADSQGLPETYTTAPGDTEDGVLERFNLGVQDLYRANPTAKPGPPASSTYLDARSGSWPRARP
ncbi:LysM repeat protein [Sinomonas atrocyanea]|uniref:LysM peptidoglycan-binding domain-containing protein n=1 Tax=Sinomonas atrocyanea TaxID=37927 RepID=UPI0027873E3A|nr:LysM domain-containing protein [Sinomonas atrocyanea]MDP9883588.1 LysM repeat protein [Sinomonas atrocyanea]